MSFGKLRKEKRATLAGRHLKYDRPRLNLVRQRVTDGFYDHAGVVSATADAITRSRALFLLLDKYDSFKHLKNNLDATPQEKSARIAEIRRRIDDGFYDDPNNLAELAERIIKKMGWE